MRVLTIDGQGRGKPPKKVLSRPSDLAPHLEVSPGSEAASAT